MKCGQVECKQNNVDRTPVAEHQHKNTHTHTQAAPPLPQLDYVPMPLCVDVSDVCVCAWVAMHLYSCMLGTLCAAGLLWYSA